MKHLISGLSWMLLLLGGWTMASARTVSLADEVYNIAAVSDTIKPRYGDFINDAQQNPFDLDEPKAVEQKVEYDPESGLYIIQEYIGEDYYRAPSYMTFSEYLEWKGQQQERSYFKELAGVKSEYGKTSRHVDPMRYIDVETNAAERLFGGMDISIKPQGNVDITLGFIGQTVENPTLPLRNQRQFQPNFNMAINASVNGKIGEKLDLGFNYNTQATFDFENQLNLGYDSEQFSEDDIVKDIEAGNVSLPLRTSLIQGNQSLFGIKTSLQFGRLRLTTVLSQQNSEQNELVIEGGDLIQEFEVDVDEYDENRHFFLSQFNRMAFDTALSCLPFINSLFNITRLEVWVTNDGRNSNNIRNVVPLADIGEYEVMTASNGQDFTNPVPFPDLDAYGNVLPYNDANTIYSQITQNNASRSLDQVVQDLTMLPFDFEQGTDFEKIQARKLTGNEYTFHPQLGFISLNIQLRMDQVLGVAYEYTYNGEVYQVGEFADQEDGNQNDTLSVLFLKMLKSTTQQVSQPEWDLMMKNFYSLGAFQIAREDFQLDVYYNDPGEGYKRFLPVDDPSLNRVPLLNLFRLDDLNAQNDPRPDGVFDFVPGLTIYPSTGRLMFPVLEPFGENLEKRIDPNISDRDRFIYNELYDTTLVIAREQFDKNRFTIRGQYKSSGNSSEINLNSFNLPRGSITVRAGGQVLVEGTDYEVEYGIGRVRILNDAFLQPGTSIRISYEDNSLFSLQRRTMLGLRADFDVSENLVVGGTFMKLFERPFTQKVNLGDDPINNNIYGLDVNFNKDAPWLTRFVDKIPGIQTKAPSSITVEAEVAALRPGHSKAINLGNDRGGSVLVDDFEGAVSSWDLRFPFNRWVIASAPRKPDSANVSPYKEAELINDLRYGANRAKLNWYRIERTIRSTEDNSNPYTAAIDQEEIFPNRARIPGQFPDIQTLDLVYYPTQKGPYNFDIPDGYSDYSAGLDEEGNLKDPETRWAGIMRHMDQNNFLRANFEFIEFWMLNPFIEVEGQEVPSDGVLYFNLGNVSEDILRDSRMLFENGLPRPAEETRTDTTNWGRIPRITNVTDAFSNVVEDRNAQDIGLDGLDDAGERIVYSDYVDAIQAGPLSPDAQIRLLQDVSNDNYAWFRDPMYGANSTVFDRYSLFNNQEGNSRQPEGGVRLEAGTNEPDAEDIDDDNSLSESETYFEYRIPIKNDGNNQVELNDFITDVQESNNRTWYRYRIPIRNPTSKVGGIQDFRSIRFMRMYLKEFDKRTVLRFGTLELVRSQWREYTTESLCPFDATPEPGELGIDAVNIEENSERRPWNYTLPPGLARERAVGQFNNVPQNEQSLALTTCDMPDGCLRGAYKQLGFDMRFYERLQMFIHAEAIEDQDALANGDYSVVVRLGSDIRQNYYEYEIPLILSRDNAPNYNPADADQVWPDSNYMDFPLSLLTELKVERDEQGFPIDQIYEKLDIDPEGNFRPRTARVRGRPNLGEVEMVLIGIKNVEQEGIDPAINTCINVWLNELRLTGLDEDGGVAALARVNMQLADFGNLSLSGSYNGVGFGSLDQRINERSREETIEFDISTNLELSQLLPGETRLRLPFYAQMSNTYVNPQYDPFDRDILLKDKLNSDISQAEKDSIRDLAQERFAIRSFNFTNVRLNPKPESAPHPFRLSNLSLTYAYSKSERRTSLIENEEIQQHRATLDYNFSTRPKYLEPFKNLSQSDWLNLITDINFNPIPNRLGFSTTFDRYFSSTSHRFADPIYKTFFDRRFLWDRRYNLNWDLTKSLKLDFRATANSIIDEPDGYKDRETLELYSKQERRDSILTNLEDLGRVLRYDHSLDLTYNVPLKAIPALDWINLRASYRSNYNWNAASLKVQQLGNVIQNAQNRQATLDMNFERLYGKSAFLKSIEGNKRRRTSRTGMRNSRDNQRNADDSNSSDSRKDKSDKESGAKKLLRPLLALRSVKFNWSEQLGTTVPGYMPGTQFLGMSPGFDAPGLDFVLGLQPDLDPNSGSYWLDDIGGQGGWITEDFTQNQEVVQNFTQNYDLKISLEPIRDLRIEILANSSFTQNHSLTYKNVLSNGVDFETRALRSIGSYNISYLSLHRIFQDDEAQLNEMFLEFQEARKRASELLPNDPNAGDHGTDEGFKEGYGSTQRDVLLPAFIASYTGRDVADVNLRLFDDRPNVLPRPNWTLNYDGLSNLKIFEKVFQRVTLSHGYTSNLTINNYQNNLEFDPTNPFQLDDDQDYFHRFRMENVTITEAFNPLIGIDVQTLNNISINFNMNRSRGLDLSLGTDLFLRETRTNDVTFGFAYLIQDVNIGFLQGNKKKRRGSRNGRTGRGGNSSQSPGSPRGNDLNITFDLSISDDITLNHLLDQEAEPIPTRGTRSVRWSPSVDYQLSRNLNLRLFVDYSKTVPKTSLAFPITSIRGGLTVRFILN